MASSSSIASRWRELSGEKNWESLLHPLDLELRRYIIHYQQRAGATADSFNNTKASKGYALSLYPCEKFFSKVGLLNGNPYHYYVTHFIYAATSDKDVAYMGYVAVTTDEGKAVMGRRDIMVSWRGTITKAEINADGDIAQVSAKELFGTETAKVHEGFYKIYTMSIVDSVYAKTSAREQARKAVQELVDKYQNEEVSITVTGHSLGGALATLNAMDIAHNGFNKPTRNPNKAFMVTAFPNASPRVGNEGFKDICDGLKNFHIIRIVNASDPVPMLPVSLLQFFSYIHVGLELKVDTTKSPYLKSDNTSAHNLEAYQHGIAGVQENGEFKLEEELDFDNATINKYGDSLLDEYKIPNDWWTNELYKNMVQMDNGHWRFNDTAYVPDPPIA